MSHRSRLCTIIIDSAQPDFERAVEFWSQALGQKPLPDPDDPKYVSLKGRIGGDGGPTVLMQSVPGDERAIHLDIESDDVEAEVERLEGLGASIKKRFPRWVVMTAPSGHPFCVVQRFRDDFEEHASEWREG